MSGIVVLRERVGGPDMIIPPVKIRMMTRFGNGGKIGKINTFIIGVRTMATGNIVPTK